MEIEGLYTATVLRSRTSLSSILSGSNSYSSSSLAADTEFYFFSPEGLAHRGYVLDEGFPSLNNYDFERAMHEMPGSTGTCRILDNDRIQINWQNSGVAPTLVLKLDSDKLKIYEETYSKYKGKNRNEEVPDNSPRLEHNTSSSGVADHTQQTSQVGFQPIGRWHIQISGGNTMLLNLNSDSTFQATQQNGYGFKAQGIGQWGFNPSNQMLQLQGLVNGFQPFMLTIIIQRQQNNEYYGFGSDGYSYCITRA